MLVIAVVGGGVGERPGEGGGWLWMSKVGLRREVLSDCLGQEASFGRQDLKWVTPHTSAPQCLDNSLPGFFSSQGYLVRDNSSKGRKCHQQKVPFLLSPASSSGSPGQLAMGWAGQEE